MPNVFVLTIIITFLKVGLLILIFEHNTKKRLLI